MPLIILSLDAVITAFAAPLRHFAYFADHFSPPMDFFADDAAPLIFFFFFDGEEECHTLKRYASPLRLMPQL